ncbi:cytoplasmic protein [Escherichia coli]|nr:cytoplasmic protein [Escherichia coli]MHN82305.1 cytoplasmic protein [Escherichia coli]
MKVTRTDLHRCYSPISFTVIRKSRLMRGSPVKGLSDNKPYSFHPSGRVFSGRRGFFHLLHQ